MKICPMTEADCEKTGLLMKECFSVPWSVEGLKEMFHTEGYCSFLAKEEEEVIGYVGMKMVLDEAVKTVIRRGKKAESAQHLSRSPCFQYSGGYLV